MSVSKQIQIITFVFLSAASHTGLAQNGKSIDVDKGVHNKVVLKAQKSLKPLKMRLMKNLKKSLKEGGPTNAINSCKLDAPKITSSVQTKGVAVGRTSNKYRNKSNRPKLWTKSLLKEFENINVEKQSSPKVVRLKDGRYGYVEPIYLKNVCLTCHGTKLDPKLEVLIDKSYPGDLAREYKLGDFRGLFWAEVTLLPKH